MRDGSISEMRRDGLLDGPGAERVRALVKEGSSFDEALVNPQVKVASIYIDQPEENDVGHQVAEKLGLPIFPTIAGALTLGGEKLAVDGVV